MNIFNYINEVASTFNKEKEVVSDKDAILAQFILSHLKIKSDYDVLLFCLSANLMNAYVKQDNALFGYYFKRSIYILLHESIKNNIDGLKMKIETNNKTTLLIVSINDVMFSFHSIEKEVKNFILDKYNANLTFDNIKKQPCSSSLFKIFKNYVFKNKLYLINLFNQGEKFVNLYLEKKIDLSLVKKYTALPSYCFKQK